MSLTEQRNINLFNKTTGILYNLNHPQATPGNVDFTQHLIAPLGDVILLEIYNVGFSENGCHNGDSIEVSDIGCVPKGRIFDYVGLHRGECTNSYELTKLVSQLQIYDNYADNNGSIWNLCELPTYDENSEIDTLLMPSPIHITSYLNTLHIRQKTIDNARNLKLNATVRIQPDFNYKYKLATGDDEVESCQPNPCQYGGKCLSNGNYKHCHCVGHYTGR